MDTIQNLKPFTSTRQPSKAARSKPRGKYLMPLLKRCLNKCIDYEDPDTKKIIHGKVKDAIVWRLLLNAAQGDNVAIKEVFERTDGKVTQVIEGELDGQKVIVHIVNYGRDKNPDTSPGVQQSDASLAIRDFSKV